MPTGKPQIFSDPQWTADGPPPGMFAQNPSVFRAPADEAPAVGVDAGMARPSSPVFSTPPMPEVTQKPAVPTREQANVDYDAGQLKRFQDRAARPYGFAGDPARGLAPNHPGVGGKILHALSVAGNIAGDIFAPATMSLIPGTELNTQANEGKFHDRLNADLTQEGADEEKAAQTKNLDLQPQLKAQQMSLAQEKQNEKEDHDHATEAQGLAQHGFAHDEANPGQLRPLRYEEMSPTQQAVTDLKGAQQEQAEATSALRLAQNDPSSPAFKLAQGRLDVARKNAATALGRLGLSSAQFEMRAHGTQNGEALPGSMIDDDGDSVGTAFQANVRPTGQERGKADMASSAAEQLNDIKNIMQKHPQLFGPGYGQGSAFKQWVGSEDPDAQRFLAARTIAADHLAGTFGGRSEAALTALDNAIGQFKDNPKAALAGVDQLTKANSRFVKAGTVKTKGSKAGEPEPDYDYVPGKGLVPGKGMVKR